MDGSFDYQSPITECFGGAKHHISANLHLTPFTTPGSNFTSSRVFPDSIPLLFDGENAGELKCSNISTFPKIEYGDSSRPIEGISTYFSHSLHGQDVENNMWANYCIGKFTAAMKGITIDLGSSLALRFVVSVNE